MSEMAKGISESDLLGVEHWVAPRTEKFVYLVLLLVALSMRLWDLDARAMHHDESMHALYSWYRALGNGYEHNPLLHGPFQFNANALLFSFFGDSNFTARLLYVVFGTALVGLPWALRPWLGRTGALISALLLTFSPTLLYFSRFARNDILMAVWIMGLVICIWHYIRGGQPKFLYLLAGFLAFAFATKETTYLTVAILGISLLLLSGVWRPREFGRFGESREFPLLIILFTFCLSQSAAVLILFQDLLGLTLGNSDNSAGPIGMPVGKTATFVAIISTGASLIVGAFLGLKWNWRCWLICAGIFYGIWLLMFTTFFTNSSGVTGIWQSLGYWVIQQGEERGGQPWFYYLVIGFTYEYLPLFVSLLGGAWYLLRGDRFSRFLLFWVTGSLVLFSFAGEKMPWLLVHITLPAILLTGRILGDLVNKISWCEALRLGTFYGLFLVPVFMFFVYQLVWFDFNDGGLRVFLILWGWLLLVGGLLLLILYLASRIGWKQGISMIALAAALTFFLLTFRTGRIVAFDYPDNAKEILVYTQTSPEIVEVLREFQRLGDKTADTNSLKVVIDGSDGFGWPWYWYLRHYQNFSVRNFEGLETGMVTNVDVLILSSENHNRLQGVLEPDMKFVRHFRHRWWFPEVYREISLGNLLTGLIDRGTWRMVLNYWLFRDLNTNPGSADAYLYYARGISQTP
jgi:uncharacterized protein (TIGR03663 family)